MDDVELALALALGLVVVSLLWLAYLVGQLRRARRQMAQYRRGLDRLTRLHQEMEELREDS